MRRTLNTILAAATVLAVASMPLTATAGQNCGSVDAKLGAKTDKAACTAATLTGDKTAKWDCDYEGKCETIAISIDGMTCGGCENSITTALSELEGVIKIHSVSYKDGLAVVCCDPTKTKGELLTKAIISKGYKAEIIPAVATLAGSTTTAAHAGCEGKDKEACAKACASKEGKTCGGKTETTPKSDGSL